MAGLVNHDSEKNELLDENTHENDGRRTVVVLERLDDFIRRRYETDEAIRDGDEDDEAERSVDRFDEAANPGVISAPFLQPDEQYPACRVGREVALDTRQHAQPLVQHAEQVGHDASHQAEQMENV